MNLTAEKRRRRSSKVVYDMLVSHIRSEEDALFHKAKQLGKMHDSPGKDNIEKEFENRKKALKTLQHSLDWLVDQIINDRRHC